MATEALSAVLDAARVLYATVQQVKANKRQAHLLADRVAAIVEPVHAFNDTRLAQTETQTALAQLLTVIQDASAFVRDFQDTGRLKRVLFKTNHTERFAELNMRLSHAAQGLTLGTVLAIHAEVSGLAESAADAHAQALDRVQDKSVLGVWAIAPAIAKFVGRDAELAALDVLLHPAPSARSPAMRVAISGMGGTGKSTLAQRAAAALADRFTSGWILDGSHRETLLSGLSNVAADLVLGELQLSQVPRAVRACLNQADRAGWLLIVDNVDDPAFAHELPSLLPNVGGCLLVTSRLAHWERDGWIMLRLDLLAKAEAVTLLSSSGNKAEDPAIFVVVERLGCLALALGQAMTYVRRTRLSWTAYVAKLDQQLSQMMPSLQLSIEAALKERPDCELVLQMLQVLHPDNIPRVIVADAFKALNATADVDDLLAVLADLSIVVLGETSLSLHRLMLHAIQQAVPGNLKAVEQLATAMAACVGRDAELDPNPQLMAMLPPHFSTLLPVLESMTNRTDAVLVATRLAVASVLVFTIGDIVTGSENCVMAFEMAERCLSKSDPLMLRCHFILACATLPSGAYQRGLGYANQLIARVQTAEIPESSPFSAMATYVLGFAHLFLQRYTDARDLIGRSAQLFATTVGPRSPITAVCNAWLSLAHNGMRDWRAAQTTAEAFAPLVERHFGPGHGYTAMFDIYLGEAICGLGDLHGGLERMDLGFKKMVRFVGMNSPATSYSILRVVSALGRAGHARRQVDLCESLLEFYTTFPLLGPAHLETGRVLSLLSNSCGNLGLVDKQHDAARRALDILSTWVQPENEFVVIATASLAMAVGAHGDVARKCALLEEALRLSTALVGPNHVDTASLMVDVALAAGATGDRDRQRDLLRRARPILETGYPLAPDGAHPMLAKALAAEADFVFAMTDSEDDVGAAVRLWEKALGMYKRTFGDMHPAVAEVHVALANAERLNGRSAGLEHA